LSEPAPAKKTYVQLRVKCPICQGVLESEPLDGKGNQSSPVLCTGCKRTWVNFKALVQAKIAANRAQRVGPVDMARLGMAKARVAVRAGRNVLDGAMNIQEMIRSIASECKNFAGQESIQTIGEDLEDIAGQALLSLDAIADAMAGRMGPQPIRTASRDITDKPAKRKSRKERKS
jgi:hypothetical protein